MGAVIRIDILGDSRSAQRSARDANSAYGRLGRGADGASRKVGLLGGALGRAAKRYGPIAAALATGAVLKLGKDSIQAASDVEQSFGAIDTVFGKNRKTVKRWANSAANDVGLARSEYASLAVVLGSMLQNTGIEDYTGQTNKLIRLGADLAATYGGSTKTAMIAISALFRGEADPIEKYGVNIKAVAIKADLASRGLGKLTGKTLAQAQQQSRLKLLFEQTSKAQGQFARESDTYAQAQQKLGANFENLKVKIGEKFMPVAARFLRWLTQTITGSNGTGRALIALGGFLRDFLGPIVEGMRRGWEKLNKKVSATTGSSDGLQKILKKVADKAIELAPIIGKKLESAADKLGTAIAVTVIVGTNLWKTLRTIRTWADRLLGPLDELAAKFGKVASAKSGLLGGVAGVFGLGNLVRSGGPLPHGLGRSSGFSAGGYGRGGAINFTNLNQLTVKVDHHALAGFIRLVTRDEISSQVLAAKRTR